MTVTGLPQEIPVKELKAYFEKYGYVKAIKRSMNKTFRESDWVQMEFMTAQEVQDILKDGKQEIIDEASVCRHLVGDYYVTCKMGHMHWNQVRLNKS